MLKNFFAFALLGLSLSCTKHVEEIKTLYVDVAKVESTRLEDIAEDIRVVPLRLPDDHFIGDITHLRTIGDYYLLLDNDRSLTITVVDEKGNYVNQLKRVGYGPEEYANLENFTLINEKELAIYDRERLRLVYYSFPELEYIKAIKVEDYWMGLRAIDNDWLVVVNDSYSDEGQYNGVQIVERNSLKPKFQQFGEFPMAIEASIDPAITSVEGEVYYANPGEFTTVYRVSKEGFDPLLKVDFGSFAMAQDKWSLDDIGEFLEVMGQENKVAAAYGYMEKAGRSSFWYMHNAYNNHYLAVEGKDNKVSSYKNISVEGLNAPLTYPKGISNEGYIHVIRRSEINSEFFKNGGNDDWDTNSDQETPFLLTYRLK